MNILFVSHSFAPPEDPLANVGGMQRVAMDLFAELSSRPDLHVVPWLLRTTWAATGRKTPGFIARGLWRIPQLVRDHRIDVVLFSSMVTATMSLVLGRTLPSHVRLVAITHGLDVTTSFAPWQRWIVPRTFDCLDLVCPVSQATAAACQQRGMDPAFIEVVPNGIDADRVLPSNDRPALRQRLNMPPVGDRLVLLSVGRQVRRKGFEWFIRHVMPQLPEQVDYWLVGEGPENASIRAAASLMSAERVRLLGKVDGELLHDLYAAADLFVMPNIVVPGDMEGFGIVMLEAGLAGLPVVASNLEGILDVVVDGDNGWLLPTEDVRAFVERISLLAADRAQLSNARELSRQSVLRRFTWAAVADQMVTALRRCSESPPRRRTNPPG